MKLQPFFAVRVVITHDDGSSTQRDYVRGETRMSVDRFGQWALGNMLALVSDGETPITWTIEAIDFETVRQNRMYHHTSHAEV